MGDKHIYVYTVGEPTFDDSDSEDEKGKEIIDGYNSEDEKGKEVIEEKIEIELFRRDGTVIPVNDWPPLFLQALEETVAQMNEAREESVDEEQEEHVHEPAETEEDTKLRMNYLDQHFWYSVMAWCWEYGVPYDQSIHSIQIDHSGRTNAEGKQYKEYKITHWDHPAPRPQRKQLLYIRKELVEAERLRGASGKLVERDAKYLVELLKHLGLATDEQEKVFFARYVCDKLNIDLPEDHIVTLVDKAE